MRSINTVLLAGAAGVLADVGPVLISRQSESLDYVQNYNGDVAGFQYVHASSRHLETII